MEETRTFTLSGRTITQHWDGLAWATVSDEAARDFSAEGAEHGHNAATWIEVDESSAASIIQGYEDGDPEVMDIAPAPLSGEWAGESLAELGLAEASDEDLSDYENGYSEAFWTELIRRCQYQVSDEG